MRALLDTHTFLWAIAGDKKLSQRAGDLYTRTNELFFSVASIWEIIIKSNLGRLPVPKPAGAYTVRMLAANQIEVLPIQLDHVLKIESLPAHHRDPFDRILAAQSLVEKLPIITADEIFDRYSVKRIW